MQQSSAAWEQFWASGSHAGCINVSEDGYRQEIVDFWQAQWADLAGHPHWLDIGTGNGAVPRLLRRWADDAQRPISISAVDAANIDYQTLAALPELRDVALHANTPVTALPFEHNVVDVISGQYAYEYMHSQDAARELARVLKPAGRLRFVMHHQKGLTALGAQQALRFIRAVEAETRIVLSMKAFIQTLCTERQGTLGGRFQPSPALLKHKQKCDKALKKLSKGADNPNTRELSQNVVGICQQLMTQNAQFTDVQMLAKLDELALSVGHYKQRLLMLSQAAVNAKSLDKIGHDLNQAGFINVGHRTIVNDKNQLIAHILEAEKA